MDSSNLPQNFNSFSRNEQDQNEENEVNGNPSFTNNNNNSIMGNSTSSQESDHTSAYDTLPSIQAIGEKQNIMSYALNEWRGNSVKAQTIKKVRSNFEENLCNFN